MKILLIDSFYSKALEKFRHDESFQNSKYELKLQSILNSGFGSTSALSFEFANLGWEAFPVIANSYELQNSWRLSAGKPVATNFGWGIGPHIARTEFAFPYSALLNSLHKTIYEQIKFVKPDVLLIQDLNLFSKPFLNSIRNYCKLLVGEIASPLPPNRMLSTYDLIISAHPSIVSHVNSLGIDSSFLPLAFDSRVLSSTKSQVKDIDLVFVGSAGRLWNTFELLKNVKKLVPGLVIYGPMKRDELTDNGLLENYMGEAWGMDMFKILARSKISLNRHGGITGNFAGNMRMYEATGMGSLLLTESSPFLPELFEPESEIATYKNYQNAGEVAAQLLLDPKKLQTISEAGQRKTLSSHTYSHRAKSMTEMFEKKLDSI